MIIGFYGLALIFCSYHYAWFLFFQSTFQSQVWFLQKFFDYAKLKLHISDKRDEDRYEKVEDLEVGLPGDIPSENPEIYTPGQKQSDISGHSLAQEWYSRCVSSEHAIGSIFWMLMWWFGNLDLSVVLAHSFSYFLNDLIHMIMYYNEMEGIGLSIVHHVVGMFAILSQMQIGSFPAWLLAYFFLTEASTPFVNLRWNLYVLDMTSKKRYILASLMMTITFFIVRTFPLPFVVWYGIVSQGIMELNKGILRPILQIIGVGLISGLNAYWSWRILLGWIGVIRKMVKSK